MHASSLLVGLLSLGALATPLPNTSETNNLVRRSNSCTASSGAAKLWSVYLDNDADHNEKCGNGCLDNIRGRCGAVQAWGCKRDSAGTGHYGFSTPDLCTLYDMTQALHACSGMTIDCHEGDVETTSV